VTALAPRAEQMLHFVQHDTKCIVATTHAVTLTEAPPHSNSLPGGREDNFPPHPRPLGEGRVRECSEMKGKCMFSLEAQ
jgi:hypothetical protein